MTRIGVVPEKLRRVKTKVGDRYGRLTVDGPADADVWGRRRWACTCACGAAAIVSEALLRNGMTQSCGCLRAEGIRRSRKTRDDCIHGMSKSREYRIWLAMKTRCYNPNDARYWNYGRRGIKVCDAWRSSFSAFYKDMGRCPSPKHSLDRIDVDGNYEPDNCRWATTAVQARNKRRKVPTEYDGEIPVAKHARAWKATSQWKAFISKQVKQRKKGGRMYEVKETRRR